MAVEISAERIKECLQDADCTEGTKEACLKLLDKGDTREAVRLLRQHRTALLERKHMEEHRIDCLDYLMYQLKKQTENVGTKE